MAKPARPELIFHSVDEMLADVDRLRGGSYEKTGQWDLPMILDHLAKSMHTMQTCEGMKPVPKPLDIVARLGVHLVTKRKYYPGIKFSAPKEMRPTVGIPLEAAEAAFRQAAEQVKAINTPTVSGTPFGTMMSDDFVKLQLLHGAHHLSFLRPV